MLVEWCIDPKKGLRASGGARACARYTRARPGLAQSHRQTARHRAIPYWDALSGWVVSQPNLASLGTDVTKSIFTAHYGRLCEFLIQARIDAGMSQAALAKCLNRPQSFVSKYESKQRRLDVVEFFELAHCLRTDGIDLVARLLDGWPNHNGVPRTKALRAAGQDGIKRDGVTLDGTSLDGVNGNRVNGDGVKSSRRTGPASDDVAPRPSQGGVRTRQPAGPGGKRKR